MKRMLHTYAHTPSCATNGNCGSGGVAHLCRSQVAGRRVYHHQSSVQSSDEGENGEMSLSMHSLDALDDEPVEARTNSRSCAAWV
jgi:hypothetical protein